MIDPSGTEAGPAYQALGHIDALPAGSMLGEFEVQGLLGFGGFGMVYRGYDHSLQRPVAIKEYMPSALVARSPDLGLSARSSADLATFKAGLASFIAEARLLARFDHPSLVKVYRFWESNNTAYMAMPLYQGITLKQARAQMTAPPPEDWLRVILWSVLEALKVLHSGDALHRDVSPDNIFLQDIGPPVLLDLGAARVAIMEGNRKHTAVLKVNYAPIEQYADVEDLREGPWTDIYALAAVIHGCICNEAPLPATIRAVKDRLPSLAKIAKTTESHFGQAYSGTLVRALDHALAIQPGDRPQSAEAFARELKLRSVSQPQRFDWRAALGDKVSLLSPTGGAAVQVVLSSTGDESAPFEVTQFQAQDLPQPVAPVKVQPDSKKKRSDPKRSPWRMVLLGALLIVVLTAALLSSNKKPDAVVIPTPPVAASETETVMILEQALPTDRVVPMVTAEAASAPALTSAVKPPPRLPGGARQISGPSKPVEEAGAKAVPDGPQADSIKADPVEAPKSIAPPKPKREGPVLCEDSNVFTRPMCIYRECQKPEFATLQVCVEDRKRWEDRDRQIRP